jgi:hypothetical protein
MNEHEEDEPHTEDDEHRAVDELANPIGDVLQVVAEQARNHPVRTLGAAFGIGYVLGGGMPSFAMRLLGIAMMRSAASMVDWDAVAESAIGMAKAERAPQPRAGRGRDGHERAGRGRAPRQTTH